MNLLSLFYVSNIIIASISFLLAILVFSTNLRYREDNPYRASSYIYTFSLSLLGAFKASTSTIITDRVVELFATQPLTLLSACICIYAMGASAFLTRSHYRFLANWVLLLFPSVAFFFINQLMMHYDYYRPIYSYGELAEFRSATPVFFFGRLTWVIMTALSVIFALVIVANALMFDRWRLTNRPTPDNTFSHHVAVRITFVWMVLLMFGFLPLYLGSIWLHLLFNLGYFLALIYSGYVCYASISERNARISGMDVATLITYRLPRLLDLEHGGSTPWGVRMSSNPFFCGNPMLDDVARSLGVTSADVQQVLSSQGTNLVSWVSEQRLLHCAQQVSETNRKIADIAIACGYNDLPSFTRAFKRQFGKSPSEYRKDTLPSLKPVTT